MVGSKDASRICFIQVKACHPDRSKTFILREENENWVDSLDDNYVIFVWLGSPRKNEAPKYWIATKRAVGQACMTHPAHDAPKHNWERRFSPRDLNPEWENNWSVFDQYLPEATSD